jgi:hypothetical protein
MAMNPIKGNTPETQALFSFTAEAIRLIYSSALSLREGLGEGGQGRIPGIMNR